MFLIPAYRYLPVRLDIPNKIFVRYGDLLHLTLFKSPYLEKGKVFRIDSLFVNAKSVYNLGFNVRESLI